MSGMPLWLRRAAPLVVTCACASCSGAGGDTDPQASAGTSEIVAQSGNIGQNLTMQRRGLPLAQLVTLGNRAGADVPDVLDAMLCVLAAADFLDGKAGAPDAGG